MSSTNKEVAPVPVAPVPVVHKAAKQLAHIIITGTFMAVIAGFINAVALMSVFTNTVSHVTGATTKFAILLVLDPSSGKLPQMILLILSFCFGAMLTGIMIKAQSFKLGRFFGVVMIMQSVLIFFGLVLYAGDSSVFAQYFLALACGMQNGSATRFSGAVVRTTHLTGIVTDIGLVLGNYIRWGDTSNLWRLKIFFSLFLGFFSGGSLGAVAFTKYGTNCLIFPGFSTLFGGIFFFVHDVLWGTHGWCLEFIPEFIMNLFSEKESSELKIVVTQHPTVEDKDKKTIP